MTVGGDRITGRNLVPEDTIYWQPAFLKDL